jgi:hypothetical protein
MRQLRRDPIPRRLRETPGGIRSVIVWAGDWNGSEGNGPREEVSGGIPREGDGDGDSRVYGEPGPHHGCVVSSFVSLLFTVSLDEGGFEKRFAAPATNAFLRSYQREKRGV